MVSVLLTWIVILGVSLAAGYNVIRLLYGSNVESLHHIDIYIICGVMFWNVYAQIFSLFYKIGAMACLLMFAIAGAYAFFAYVSRKQKEGSDFIRYQIGGVGI